MTRQFSEQSYLDFRNDHRLLEDELEFQTAETNGMIKVLHVDSGVITYLQTGILYFRNWNMFPPAVRS